MGWDYLAAFGRFTPYFERERRRFSTPVASSVPQAIYTIPPSSPLYPVTYVIQYQQSPEVVVSSYTSGYTGCYVSFGVSFWGTGYYYPPYWHYDVLFGLKVLAEAGIALENASVDRPVDESHFECAKCLRQS